MIPRQTTPRGFAPTMTIRRSRLVLVLALLAAGLLIAAAPALAAFGSHTYTSSFGASGTGDGQFGFASPRGAAVDQSTGDLYVADSANARIERFQADGTFVAAWGWGVSDGSAAYQVCTSSCQAGISGSGAGQFAAPAFVAVDNSGGPSAGDVYVGDGQHVVQKFDSAGNYLSTNDGSASGGPFAALAGIAVDSGGALWVYDVNSQMREFAQDGSFIIRWNSGYGVSPAGIGVDASDDLYVLRGFPAVEKFSPTGQDLGELDGSGTATALTASPNQIYVAQGASVALFDAGCALPDCTPRETFGSSNITSARGVAVNPSTGRVYVSDAGNTEVDVFDAAILPDVTTTAATNVTSTSATLNGTVNPDGVPIIDCHFDYGTTPDGYGQSVPCAESLGSIDPGGGPQAVHADLSGLIADHNYHFRLVAANANGSVDGGGLFLRGVFTWFNFDSASASLSTTQAGAHPDFTTSFSFVHANGVPAADPREIATVLPPGLIANPAAFPQCNTAEFTTIIVNSLPGGGSCPQDAQVGIVQLLGGEAPQPLYNLTPSGSDTSVARLGFYVDLAPVIVDVRVLPDYRLEAVVEGTGVSPVLGATTTIWGVPADPSHDSERFSPLEANQCQGPCGGPVPSGLPETPFVSNPTSCDPKQVDFAARSYEIPDVWVSASAALPDITGCASVPFNPSISPVPTTQEADSPGGLDVNLHIPQPGLTEPNGGLASAHLKKAVVTLPEGMALNPSAADGLQGCTEAEIGLVSEGPPATFDASTPSCPLGSKVGSAEITTPVLKNPIPGSLYLADPNDNPFHSLLTGYLVAHGEGVLLKIPGRFDLDPSTGRITATFDNNPQQPFSDLNLHFKGGSRGVLVTPPSCGHYQIQSELTPWSGNPPTDLTTGFDVTSGPGGGPCPDYTDPARFTPGFQAGTTVPLAGSGTGFALKVTRPDGQQSLKQIHVDLPPGLVAHLAGVPRCSQAQINPGINGSTNCPAGSQIGTVNVGAGAGSPFFLKNQPVYLTDGYGGAPYGIAIDTHAVAGPLDLGHVVVRSTLNVDQDDAQVHIDSETLPWILQGIPLHIRSVAVNIDRPGFMQNPTNCNPMTVTGTVTGGGADFNAPGDDTVKPVADHFQVGGCGALGFNPKLSGAILNGAQGIHRSDHPNLSFDLHATPGDANLSSVAVTLPQAFQIDQANLGNICSETELAQTQCAGRNTVGTASATTPLLDSKLSGPVYAVSGSGGLPKLAVILNGPAADPVHLLVRGITDTVGARIRNTFPLVPDTPITDFNLTLNGGPQGYLVNNTDVCGTVKKHKGKKKLVKTPLTADANFTAQDGDTLAQSVPISAQCPKAKKKSRHAKHRRHRG